MKKLIIILLLVSQTSQAAPSLWKDGVCRNVSVSKYRAITKEVIELSAEVGKGIDYVDALLQKRQLACMNKCKQDAKRPVCLLVMPE